MTATVAVAEPPEDNPETTIGKMFPDGMPTEAVPEATLGE